MSDTDDALEAAFDWRMPDADRRKVLSLLREALKWRGRMSMGGGASAIVDGLLGEIAGVLEENGYAVEEYT